MPAELLGRLVTGMGQGAHFTRLDWVRIQLLDKLGMDPFPGTVNLVIDDTGSLRIWNRIKSTPGVRLENPRGHPGDCHARCYAASIEGTIAAAIVLPEIAGYPPGQIEIIAAERVRSSLGVEDGALLRVEVRDEDSERGC